jgi:hypothetical protein
MTTWEMAKILRMEGQFVQYQAGYLPEPSYQTMLDVARQTEPLWKELEIQSRNAEFRRALEGDGDV